MNADNSVTRSSREAEVSVEPSGFQMPPELATQYQVRIIEPADGGERRIGIFLQGDRENPSIEVGGNGDRIVAQNENPETVAALVKIAQHNGWEGIDVEGSPEFRKAVWLAASREGLTVRGYDPEFGEQAQIETLRREDAAKRQREAVKAAPAAEQVLPKTAAEVSDATIPARTAGVGRVAQPQAASPRTNGAKLSQGDQRLLLTLSSYTQDRKALTENMRPDMQPMEREFQSERLDLNRDALGGALEHVLESPSLVSAFSRSGYEPDDLRKMAREGAWDSEVADAVYLVRSGLNRNDPAKDAGTGATIADELAADREDRSVAESTRAPERPSTPEPTIAREKRQHDDAAERRLENEELAELFLQGGAERVAAEPRLANALEAQATMEKHLGEAFDGDASRMTAATLESRQMISDVLRRGLDVSVREPTPVRQIEPSQTAPDLER